MAQASWLNSKNHHKFAQAMMLCQNASAECASTGECSFNGECFKNQKPDSVVLSEISERLERLEGMMEKINQPDFWRFILQGVK